MTLLANGVDIKVIRSAEHGLSNGMTEFRYTVLADGQPTDIYEVYGFKNGAQFSEGGVLLRELRCGADALDLMACDMTQMLQWLSSHLQPQPPVSPAEA